MRKFILLLLLCSITFASIGQGFRIVVHIDSSIRKPLTGRLYVFTQPDTAKGVRDPDPFYPTPAFHKEVSGWTHSQTQVFEGDYPGYPVSLGNLKPGWYKFAAVADVDTEERSYTAVPGNCYSRRDVLVEVKQGETTEAHIHINAVFGERPFKETESTRKVTVKSALLSSFHKKDIFMKAAVVLPPSYKTDPGRKYPVVFIIPGWGGTHFDAQQKSTQDRYGMGLGKEKIYVYLNPETQTPFGLHAFVDSRVNGPWGKALVTEFKPWLMKEYRITPDPSQHFLAGQSSGGYGVLWLQLNYPDDFGACWAVSPDPVDFSNYISINLYEPGVNVYYDKEGKERPFFILDGKPVSTMKKFMDFEHFMGDGGQQQSFEAEFGVMGANGKPEPLFDVTTGAVYPEVVQKWKDYDLGLYIRRRWKELGPKLAGKVYVFAGADDNFFLQESVEAFRKKADEVNAAVLAEWVKGNHWTIWNKEFTARMQGEFDKKIK